MLKKINVLLFSLLICGCSVWSNSGRQSFWRGSRSQYVSSTSEMTDYSRVDLGNAESFRVAVLLPLSGSNEATGQNMKNAVMMAIGDINNNNLLVQFYDTKGTGSGARVAFENAVNDKSRLILGPLLAEEVTAISAGAQSKDIPVVSFSTSPAVLQEGIYTLGLLNEQQIKRIVRYAAAQGRTRLAVVLPDNQSGLNMYKSVMKAAQSAGVQVTKVGFYAPSAMDFSGLVTSMISGHQGSDFGFDALLVPESGNRLKSITSMFSYYDVSAPDVLFLGTSVWGNTGLSKETELYGAVYPMMSLARQENFEQKYNELFATRPHGLSILAYDAVQLAAEVMFSQNRNLEAEITRFEGFNGMSGVFRILPNGQSEHGLDVVRVSASGATVAEAASPQFIDTPSRSSVDTFGYMMTLPQIYGKDAAEVNRFLNGMQ